MNEKTDTEWQSILTPEQYRILRKAGTERAGTGLHLNENRDGVYYCVGCKSPLFVSDTKFDAGCGWPSFFDVINQNAVEEHADNTGGRMRTEIRCASCKGHLGHVFSDGPMPTGLRYCLNGNILEFIKN